MCGLKPRPETWTQLYYKYTCCRIRCLIGDVWLLKIVTWVKSLDDIDDRLYQQLHADVMQVSDVFKRYKTLMEHSSMQGNAIVLKALEINRYVL